MNPGLARLQAYPFERLRQLLAGATPPANLSNISLSIGEPRHEPPAFVLERLAASLHELGSYPATRGLPELRAAMAGALQRRFPTSGLQLDPETMVLPVNGTREALFAFVQTVVNPRRAALVAMPNPGYQIYEGAALLAGAEPYFLNTTAAGGFVPDLDAVPAAVWRRCQLPFLCSPGNPTGKVLPLHYLRFALELADRYGFIIAADECYADLYLDEPIRARACCRRLPSPAIVHSSAASCSTVCRNARACRGCAPGWSRATRNLSSVSCSTAPITAARCRYRPSGPALPPGAMIGTSAPTVTCISRSSNKCCRFCAACCRFEMPDGAFYLWARVDGDDARFARVLYEAAHLIVLPGSFMAREAHGENPGRGRVRISLVPDLPQCLEAAARLRQFLAT